MPCCTASQIAQSLAIDEIPELGGVAVVEVGLVELERLEQEMTGDGGVRGAARLQDERPGAIPSQVRHHEPPCIPHERSAVRHKPASCCIRICSRESRLRSRRGVSSCSRAAPRTPPSPVISCSSRSSSTSPTSTTATPPSSGISSIARTGRSARRCSRASARACTSAATTLPWKTSASTSVAYVLDRIGDAVDVT